MTLPTKETNSKKRKEYPLYSGCLAYFPDALMEVARVSYKATQQHHPGKPMHWDRDKSNDHADCAARHLAQQGKFDDDGERHSAKAAWRALANLQIELEEAYGEEAADKVSIHAGTTALANCHGTPISVGSLPDSYPRE